MKIIIIIIALFTFGATSYAQEQLTIGDIDNHPEISAYYIIDAPTTKGQEINYAGARKIADLTNINLSELDIKIDDLHSKNYLILGENKILVIKSKAELLNELNDKNDK